MTRIKTGLETASALYISRITAMMLEGYQTPKTANNKRYGGYKTMSKTTYYAHNAYLTTDDGKIYRAVAIAGSWRLAIKASDTKYVFVNDTCYESAAEALEAVNG